VHAPVRAVHLEPVIGPETIRQNAVSVGSSTSAQPKNWNPLTP
jgi:hypothetical protein